MLRTVNGDFEAVREDIGDLVTRRALPTNQVEQIDPFLFLNHHGPQVYPPENKGLPFGPHPHRGFETVTFILSGELSHLDTAGHESIINAGGVQWMTAGSGLVHAELSPEDFKKNGGPLEILQLWVNLPSRLKMTKPRYVGLQKAQIPSFPVDEGRVTLNLVSGQWEGHRGPFQSLTDVHAMILRFSSSGGKIHLTVPSTRSIFCYVVAGTVRVNGRSISEFHLADFGPQGEELQIESEGPSQVLLCHADPLKEPVVSYGPFVMNTQEEILQALRDYEAGKFG